MPQNSKRLPAERPQSTKKEKSHTKTKRTNEGREPSQGSGKNAFSGHKTANNVPRSSTSSQNQALGIALLPPNSNQESNTDDMVNDVAGGFENFSLSGASPHLNTDYTVHPSSQFQLYRVLRMVWSEPKGWGKGKSNPTEITYEGGFEKTRRFVIISVFDGHCICLAISTYTGQGVMKQGVKAKDHAMIYSTDVAPPFIRGELQRGLKPEAIRIALDNPRDKLDTASRLNFAKLYTVEHNSRVKFIGRVHESTERVLLINYNSVHDKRLVSASDSVRDGTKTAFPEQEDTLAGSSMASPYTTSMSPTNWPETQALQRNPAYYPPSTSSNTPSAFAIAPVPQVTRGSSSISASPYSAAYDVHQYSQAAATHTAPTLSMSHSLGGQHSTSSYNTTYPANTAHATYDSQYSNQGQRFYDPSANYSNAYNNSAYSTPDDLAGTGQTFSDQNYSLSNSNQNYHYQGDGYNNYYNNRDR